MAWKSHFHSGKGYSGYIIIGNPTLNFFGYILTSLKWHHSLNAMIFRNIFVHAHNIIWRHLVT